ncbi:Uncharacterised protein [Vibrio cholerae]|nr:Uncharacterised protein [Vibrio cholerae]
MTLDAEIIDDRAKLLPASLHRCCSASQQFCAQ